MLRSPCIGNICFPSGAGTTASGPVLLSAEAFVGVRPRHVHTRALPGCWSAGYLLGQLSGNPAAGLLRAGSPSLCPPFFKCIHQISLSPYSVPGMLLRLEITDGNRAPDSRGSQSRRGRPCVTRRWPHSDGADRKRGEGGLRLLGCFGTSLGRKTFTGSLRRAGVRLGCLAT